MTHGSLATAGFATVALLSTILAARAEAPAQPCAERSKVIERLAEAYGETLQSVGLHDRSGVLEVYASEATGTWTILLTRPDGVACLLASGQAWEVQAQPLKPQGKDA